MATIGLPNGSLYEATLDLLKKIGVKVKISGRNSEALVEGIGIIDRALFIRPQDIPEAIIDEMIDFGICGWDCVRESNTQDKVRKIVELEYGKKTRNPVRVVVFGKSRELIDDETIRVTSEYPRLTQSLFRKATIRFSHGSTEVKVKEGKYHYGVGITETGDSIEDNNPHIIKMLLVSPTVLIAREESPEIKFFGQLLLGALQAEKYQLVKMNVEARIKEDVLAVLPALGTPTIDVRSDGSFAIETVALKSQLADLILKLKAIGATAILVQDINVIM
jgi:ATP phosphoribosyltransferase